MLRPTPSRIAEEAVPSRALIFMVFPAGPNRTIGMVYQPVRTCMQVPADAIGTRKVRHDDAPNRTSAPRNCCPSTFAVSGSRGQGVPDTTLTSRAFARVRLEDKTSRRAQLAPQHCLNLRPDPQGHGALRPTLVR